MKFGKIMTIVFLAALLSVTAFVLSADVCQSDAAEDGFSEAIGTINDNRYALRSSEPIMYDGSIGHDAKYVASDADLELSDAAFLSYFYWGDSSAISAIAVASPIGGEYYYRYLIDYSEKPSYLCLNRGGTEIFLDVGTYKITIEKPSGISNIRFCKVKSNGDSSEYFDKSNSMTLVVRSPASYKFTGNGSSSASLFQIMYKIDGYTNMVTDDFDAEFENVKITTSYTWKYADFSPEAGNIHLNRMDVWVYEKGSAEEKMMFDDYVNVNKICTDPYTTNIEGGKDYTVFFFEKRSNNSSTISYQVDGEYKKKDITISSNQSVDYTFYAKAYETFDIAVSYDVQRYSVFLVSSQGTELHLVSDMLYRMNNNSADTYSLKVMAIGSSEESDLFECELGVYVSNLTSNDNTTVVFAIVCVVLFVVVFAILILSGKKPGWSNKK